MPEVRHAVSSEFNLRQMYILFYVDCPSSYYEDDLLRSCQPCVAPCVTCYSREFCRSCEQPLYLHAQSCVENCPNTTFLVAQNSTCIACAFPCLTCTGASMCTSCRAGYLFYRGISSAECLPGPLCPNNLYLNEQTMECVELVGCSANTFR